MGEARIDGLSGKENRESVELKKGGSQNPPFSFTVEMGISIPTNHVQGYEYRF